MYTYIYFVVCSYIRISLLISQINNISINLFWHTNLLYLLCAQLLLFVAVADTVKHCCSIVLLLLLAYHIILH